MKKRGLPTGTKQGMGMCNALAPRERERERVMNTTLASHLSTDETSRKIFAAQPESGISIFDPVLCELVYRWFCPPNGLVLDPFAGGSVRGIVAAYLGRKYIGIDLRKEQIEANRVQAAALVPDKQPEWFVGDSVKMRSLVTCEADLVFSCPPYADLEVYSDDPADISNMEYQKFKEAYRTIISESVSFLKDDRFAVFVVGEVRSGAQGYYYGLVPDTVKAFEDAGARFYNEAILITCAGSLPIRAGRPFVSSRKLGKTHQNVLVFCKGDPKKATDACGEIKIEELAFPDQEFGEELSVPAT